MTRLGHVTVGGRDDALETRLRGAIRSQLRDGQRVALARIAKLMALGSRSIQRHLQAHGTSYGRVLKEERMKLAAELTQAGISREAVADALGYRSTRSIDRMRSESFRE